MPDRLVVDSQNFLKEVSYHEKEKHPAWLRMAAQFFSYLFHPLFIPLYITFFLIRVNPYLFSGIDDRERLYNLLQVFVNCTFLPLMALLLLKGLKFIDSLMLKTQKDRILPYIICMVFYFWNWYAFRNNHDLKELTSLSLAIFIACIGGFLANISFKISMHAISAGVLSTFIATLAFSDSSSLTLYLSLAVVITGITCTSRLIVSDHSPKEIYTGLVLGICSQLLANYFV